MESFNESHVSSRLSRDTLSVVQIGDLLKRPSSHRRKRKSLLILEKRQALACGNIEAAFSAQRLKIRFVTTVRFDGRTGLLDQSNRTRARFVAFLNTFSRPKASRRSLNQSTKHQRNYKSILWLDVGWRGFRECVVDEWRGEDTIERVLESRAPQRPRWRLERDDSITFLET